MEEIYLDEKLKGYYLKDFNENVLMETHTFWKLSEHVKPYLISLNSIRTIQPLYSKFPDNPNSLSNNESYLTIAYSKDIELTLFREILPFLIVKFNDFKEEMKFYYTFSEAKDNCNYSPEKTKFLLGCICNPDYFRINQILLTFESYDNKKHTEFWNDLTDKFLEIDTRITH